MDDIRTIRRANLVALLKEFGRERLARAAGTSPAYLSQLKSRRTQADIGHDLARRLERATRKPAGWMDQPHNDNDAEVIAEAVEGLDQRTRSAVAALLRVLTSNPMLAGRLGRIADSSVLNAPARGGIDETDESGSDPRE